MKASYMALFFAWLAGPVSVGIFDTIWLGAWILALLPVTWLPVANLLALIVALVCWTFADALPETQHRVQIRYVVPSVLGSLAMLSGLTWAPFLWSWGLFEV